MDVKTKKRNSNEYYGCKKSKPGKFLGSHATNQKREQKKLPSLLKESSQEEEKEASQTERPTHFATSPLPDFPDGIPISIISIPAPRRSPCTL
jgi:hypothetical protein